MLAYWKMRKKLFGATKAWMPLTLESALADDFKPLTDWRASSEYRMLSAQNLLRRFFLENDAQTEQPVQLAVA